MILSIEWLKEHLKTTKSAEEICNKLNEIGLEVENTLPNKSTFEKIIVAEIQECEIHPNSDHLHVCKVFDGKETYQVVCGAPNARAGIKVALALIGAYIPNGDFRIKKSKIRGVDSFGMMCSERELGISNCHEGIIELPSNCKLGALFVDEYNALEKIPIEISITPNRGDATSVYGIARDLSACDYGKLLEQKAHEEIKEKLQNQHSVKVNIDNCRYFCREIKGINQNVKTPKFILERNEMNGCSDNGIIVNILNYIMFNYGQPMHSYDLDKIGKNIIIDYAKNDTFLTLKGETIKYDKSKILAVSDENTDICIAGIMGGENSKTTNKTQNILLESAYFPTTPITIGGQELKINSDARFRYERGIDPSKTEKMLNLATSMIIEYCGGEASNIASDGKINDCKTIVYPLDLTKKLCNIEITKERSIEILKKLQFIILDDKNNNELTIEVPNFRHDVEIKEDIAEELARIEGYDKIQNATEFYKFKIVKNKNFNLKMKIKKYLASCGLIESISMAFCNENKAKLFCDHINDDLRLLNPITPDLNYMRPTLLVSLLQTIKTNESNIIENQMAFFEDGMFFTSPNKNGQHNSVAGVYCGNAISSDHFKEARQFDIFDAKKDLFNILTQIYGMNIKNIKIKQSEKKYTHPTRSFDLIARKYDKEIIIATFGEINPIILNEYGIKNPVCFFELLLDNLPDIKEKSGQFLENNIQPIIRDISFIVDEKITANDLITACKDDIIASIKIIDIFKIPLKNKKSVAIRYTFKPKEQMANEQINTLMNKIIKDITTKTNGTVRDGKNL